MGKMFIIVSTIILLLVVIQRNTSNNIRLFKRLKNIIFEINSVYLELFKDRSLARRIIQGTLIIVAEIFITDSVATAVLKHIDIYNNFFIDLIFFLFNNISSEINSEIILYKDDLIFNCHPLLEVLYIFIISKISLSIFFLTLLFFGSDVGKLIILFNIGII